MQSLDALTASIQHGEYFKMYVPKDVEYSPELVRKLSELFGGCTIYTGVGTWIGEDGKLINESVEIIEAYHSLNEEGEKSLFRYIYDWALATAQEVVAITTDRGLSLLNIDTLRRLI